MIARLVGPFDVGAALPLQRTLCDLVASDGVVIDLSRASHLATAAMGALTAAHDEAARHRTSVHVTGASRALLRQLRRSGLDKRLNYYANLADAVESALAARDAEMSGR